MSFDEPGDTESYVTVEVVAQFLGVTRMTVHRWVTGLGLPSHKLGRARRFKLSEVDMWAKSRCITPTPDQTRVS